MLASFAPSNCSALTPTPLGRSDGNSPSPWAKYLSFSPSAPSPKPAPSSRAAPRGDRPPPSTQHVLEINPFEESFSSLRKAAPTPGRSDAPQILGSRRSLSKRGASGSTTLEEERMDMRDAKRPKLSLGLKGAKDSSTSATTDSSFASSRSGSASSKATTVSPNSSVAPSPVMDTKVDTKGLLGQLATSAAAAPMPFHYQPAPLPINLNNNRHNMPQQPFYPPQHAATMAPASTTFAAFAPDNLSFDGSMTYDPFASRPPTSINPVALPTLPIPPPLDLPGAVSEAPVYAPKKRGRKPKGAPVVVDTEADRAAALERNRVAASKSRQRKKERVGNLELTASDLASSNVALQKQCLDLRAELDSLRALMTQVHPGGCSCEHVNGYLARERAGGGIPTIDRIAGDVLSRDYVRTPTTWQAADDVYQAKKTAAQMEAQAMDQDGSDGGAYEGAALKNAIPLRRRT